MKKVKIMGLILGSIIITFVFVIVAGCGGNGNGDGGGETIKKLEVRGDIAPNGGEILVSDPGSPILGAALRIPEAGISETTTFSIYSTTKSINLPNGTKQVSFIVDIEGASPIRFNLPAEVTIPYDGSQVSNPELVLPFTIDSNSGSLQPLQKLKIDIGNNTITARTGHLSSFILLVWDPIGALSREILLNQIDVDTGFRPGNNGFFISNFGSYSSPGGNCMGMSAYANWYYTNKTLTGEDPTPLYRKYRQGVLNDPGDDYIASEVAIRSFIAVAQKWAKILWLFQDFLSLTDDADTGFQLVATMAITGQPQILVLGTDLVPKHAVSVYKYENGNFYIYDNNYPNQEIIIPYAYSTGFSNYGAYNNLAYDSISTYIYSRELGGIYLGAEIGFVDNSIYPTINVTSHIDGQHVATNTILLEGSVTGGEIPDTRLFIYHTNGLEYEIGLGNQGQFSQELPLYMGENLLYLYAGQKAEWGYSALKIMRIYYDVVSEADILITLTWDKNNTDVDLYVTDPSGETVWYSHMLSAIGGELDIDDTSGYGPEHYTLSTIQGDRLIQGTYSIRVHYYSDHGTGQPITYLVKVDIRGRETTNYWGAILESNPDNDLPGSTGIDWKDITTFVIP